MKEYHDLPALELCTIINNLTVDLYDDGLPMSKELNADLVSKIHWIAHELECRLGGHGGYKYATGPCICEMPPSISDHLRGLCKTSN